MQFIKNSLSSAKGAVFNRYTFAAATIFSASAGGYLAYTGQLTPLAAMTAEKVSTLAAGAYALGCQGCALAAPYYNQMASAANQRYALPALNSLASSLSAKVVPIATMTGLTPLTLSIGLGVGATALLIIIVLIRKNRALSKELETDKKTLIAKNEEIESKNKQIEEQIATGDSLRSHEIKLNKALKNRDSRIGKLLEDFDNLEEVFKALQEENQVKENLIARQYKEIEGLQKSKGSDKEHIEKLKKEVKELIATTHELTSQNADLIKGQEDVLNSNESLLLELQEFFKEKVALEEVIQTQRKKVEELIQKLSKALRDNNEFRKEIDSLKGTIRLLQGTIQNLNQDNQALKSVVADKDLSKLQGNPYAVLSVDE